MCWACVLIKVIWRQVFGKREVCFPVKTNYFVAFIFFKVRWQCYLLWRILKVTGKEVYVGNSVGDSISFFLVLESSGWFHLHVTGFICGTSRCKTKQISEWNAMVSKCLKIACILVCSLRQLMTAKVIPWTPKAGNSSSYKLSNSKKCPCDLLFSISPASGASQPCSSHCFQPPFSPSWPSTPATRPPLFLVCPLQATPSSSAFALLLFVTRVRIAMWSLGWCL